MVVMTPTMQLGERATIPCELGRESGREVLLASHHSLQIDLCFLGERERVSVGMRNRPL